MGVLRLLRRLTLRHVQAHGPPFIRRITLTEMIISIIFTPYPCGWFLLNYTEG